MLEQSGEPSRVSDRVVPSKMIRPELSARLAKRYQDLLHSGDRDLESRIQELSRF